MKTPISQKLEDGFALPIAIGVGVIAILIATTMVIRSNQSQVASLSQRSTYKSLAAAETGVAKYLTFFNKHRELAAIEPGASAGDWENLRDAIRTLPGCGNYADSEEVLDGFGTSIDIDGSDPKQGRYFLEDYTLSGSSGLLKVRGQANDQAEAGTTNLEVGFPINQVPLASTEPGNSSDDCGDLATSIPVNSSDVLPFGNGQQLIDKVKAEVPHELISSTEIVIFNDSDPDKANKILPLSSAGSGDIHTYIIDTSPGSPAITLGLDEFVQIEDNKIVFLVTDGDIDVDEGYFLLGMNSSLFIISSGKVTLRSTSSRPPLAMPSGATGSRFPFHIYLTGADPDPAVPGDAGELVLDVNERPFTIPITVYAPFGTVDMNNSHPSVPDAFQGEVWAKEFSVSPAIDDTFRTIPGTLGTFATESYPPFWSAALNIYNLSNTRIRSIDTWKKVGAP